MRFYLRSAVLRLLRYKNLLQYCPKDRRIRVVFISLIFISCLFLFSRYKRKEQNVFVSSSYYVRESGSSYSQDVVRLLILSETDFDNPDMYCNLDGQLVEPILSSAFGEPICKWKTYFMDCPVTERPRQIALVNSNDNVRHELELVQVDTTPRQLVVCFSRLYFFDEWQAALGAIEIYRQHGADLMVIPVISIVDQLYTLLKAYERAGTVRLKPGTLIPKLSDLGYNPNAEVEWLNHIITHTECMYDYRETADFVLNVDIEEVLFPRTGDLKAELYALATEFPNAASFEFLTAKSYARGQTKPSAYKIPELLTETFVLTLFQNGSSVVRPKRVQMIFKDTPLTEEHLVSSYGHHKMNKSDSQIVKFWRVLDDDASYYIPTPNIYVSKLASKYEHLDARFHEFLNKTPAAKQAFYDLPTVHEYSDPLEKCVRYNSNVRMYGLTFDQCPNIGHCKWSFENTTTVPPCIVLQTEARQTQLTRSLNIISVDSYSYPLSPDCRSTFAETLLN